jgi:hypothetical protein
MGFAVLEVHSSHIRGRPRLPTVSRGPPPCLLNFYIFSQINVEIKKIKTSFQPMFGWCRGSVTTG